jgi:hypothetical protein
MGDSKSKQFGNEYLDQLSGQLDKKAPVFNQSLFAGAGDATKNAWGVGSQFGNTMVANGGFTDPMRSAMSTFGDVANGYASAGANSSRMLQPIYEGYGSAGTDSTNMLSPLYSGYGSAGANSRNMLSPVYGGFGAIAGGNGLSDTQDFALGGATGLAGTYGGLATAYDPNSAPYKTLRQGIIDDTLTGVGSLYSSNGRFGSDIMAEGAAKGLEEGLAGLDYTNMQNDVSNRYRAADSLGGLYGNIFGMGQQGTANQLAGLSGQAGVGNSMFANDTAALAGQAGIGNSIFANRAAALAGQGATANSIFGNEAAALAGQQGAAQSLFGAGQQGVDNQTRAIDTLTQIGAARDANRQGKLLGEADLFDRTKNAELDRLLKIGGGFGGAATDAANQPSWWQQLLGYGVQAAGTAAGTAWGGR